MSWWWMALQVAFADELHASGDLAVAYGRNLGQELNVAALAGELKVHVDPRLAVGVRLASGIGLSLRESGARGYLGLPLQLKAEAFLDESRNRPFVGLGLGATPTTAAGVIVETDNANVKGLAWGVAGVIPTVMPEVGVALSGLRVALQYNLLLGSGKKAAASVQAGTAGVSADVDEAVPGLDGLMLQVGAHFGGPKKP
jgi:hypothetical protein